MPRVLILDPAADRYAALVRHASLPALQLQASSTAADVDPSGFEVIFGAPDLVASVLPRASDAEWVQSTWAGVRPLLTATMPRPDIRITGVKGVFGAAMSEYVFAYLLLIHQRALERRDAQAAGQWRALVPRRLSGKVMGIMGVGDIGASVAATARHFGMHVRGLTRSGRSESVDEAYRTEDRLAFVTGLDVLVCLLPDTPQTRGIVDAEFLDRLSPGAIVINAGRGSTVDEKALVAALRRGRPAWAVLDVFQEEPLPDDHPLWAIDNAFITFHTAAVSHPEDIAPIFIENYRRYLHGEPLLYRVDLERGY